MLNVIKNNDKVHEIELEQDLLTFGMEAYGFLDLFNGDEVRKFSNLVTVFVQEHSSIHILIPQIEATLRVVLEVKGFNTLKEKRENLMENELGGLLNKPPVKEILGQNLCKYLELKYVDNEAINLRNEVSHALLELDQFNHMNSFSIIHTIMMVLASK